MINKLWTILNKGVPTNPETTDWVRRTFGSGFKLTPEIEGILNIMLPEGDQSLKGRLIEAWIKAAMLSKFAPLLKAADPCNTYDTPVTGNNQEVTVVVTEGALYNIQLVDKEPTVYKTTFEVTFNTVDNTYTIDGKIISAEAPSTQAPGNTLLRLSFAGTSFTHTATVTVKQTPSCPPLDLLLNRLEDIRIHQWAEAGMDRIFTGDNRFDKLGALLWQINTLA